MPAYQLWKQEKIEQALQKYQLKACVDPLITSELHSRRRVTLSSYKNKNEIKLGFNIYHDNEIIDITECHIMLPQLISKLGAIKQMISIIDNQAGCFKINLLWTEEGLDVNFKSIKSLALKRRQAIINCALTSDIARVSLDSEILIEQRKPYIKFGDVAVQIAPGSFVQALASVEHQMVKFAISHLAKCKAALDLFAGSGSFTFPLLKYMHIHAVEYEKQALNVMKEAYNQHHYKLKRLTMEQRDLFNMPLQSKDLNKYDAVLFDPPRAGALAQCYELAKSSVTKIVAISCNASSLVRDLKILQDGGYNIDKIIPIDQFIWSEHCEIVALLSKKRAKPVWRL